MNTCTTATRTCTSLTSPTGASLQLAGEDLRDATPRLSASASSACSSLAGVHPGPWEARLRRAIDAKLFLLHYQPIVALDGGHVSHYEALLRLADCPGGELVAPGSFLAVAEDSGLIREIDRMVLNEAICLLGAELADRHTPVAVNLSALSVSGEGTLDHIESLLRRYRVDPRRLIVEVTETAAITDMARASAFCRDLRLLGCSVALDDFGAGFGSFRYLKRLPFDFLKIDGDFVRALPHSHNDQLVVQALVRVAKGMGKRTIAEYVGDRQTIELLHEYGVDYGQGFGIGRPQAPLEVFAAAA